MSRDLRTEPVTTFAYFAYGSNLHPVRMASRLLAPRLLGRADLRGYALRFDKRGRDGSGKCTIEPADDCVTGAVYVLSAADRHRLDEIEGVGSGYDCRVLHLPAHGEVYTYVARPDARAPDLPVFDWYLGLVTAGARYLDFPAPCLARLHAIATCPDPDPARARLNADLIAACLAHPPPGCISPFPATP